MWVDRHAFEELIECAASQSQEFGRQYQAFHSGKKKPPLVRKEGQPGFSYRKCPHCGNMMNRKRFKRISDIVLDECAIHGVWLDADELAAVARFVAQGGLARAEAHEARQKAMQSSEVIIVNSHEVASGEVPEDLMDELDMDGFDQGDDVSGTVEQEIIIEHDDGRVVKRRTTRRVRNAKLKSFLKSILDEQIAD